MPQQFQPDGKMTHRYRPTVHDGCSFCGFGPGAFVHNGHEANREVQTLTLAIEDAERRKGTTDDVLYHKVQDAKIALWQQHIAFINGGTDGSTSQQPV